METHKVVKVTAVLASMGGAVMTQELLLAAVRLDRAFLPGMLERKSGVARPMSFVKGSLQASRTGCQYR